MTVSLSKTVKRVSLKKQDGSQLKQVIVGLHWLGKKIEQKPSKGFFGAIKNALNSAAESVQSTDLDASVVALDSMGNVVDTVWFREPDGYGSNGAIKHLGDNRHGGVENVSVDLERLPSQITGLYFVINSFTNQHFSEISEARCEITEKNSGVVAVEQSLTDISGPHTALVLCKFMREQEGWTAHHIGHACNGRTVVDIIDVIKRTGL